MLAKFLVVSTIIWKCSIGATSGCLPADDSIYLDGYTQIVELGQKIPIHINKVDAVANEKITIKIYENNILEYKYTDYSLLFINRTFYINGINQIHYSKQIKIIVNYENDGIEDSICKFIYFTPSFKTYKVKEKENKIPKDVAFRYDFSMKGNDYKVSKSYEEFYINGENKISTSESRFIDFSTFEIYSTKNNFNFETCEFRLYKKLDYTDLLYKENAYTSFDLSIEKINDKKYKLVNDERFYVDQLNGGIYENKTNNCDDEMYNFFIPLYLNSIEKIKFEIIFYDIGLSHCDFIFQGYIYTDKLNENLDFGGGLDYCYKELYENLEDVEYE